MSEKDVAKYVLIQLFTQCSTERVTDCVSKLVQRSMSASQQQDGEQVSSSSMIMDFIPLSQPSPYRTEHPPATEMHLSPFSQAQTSILRRKEGSKPTDEARYDDGFPEIPSVPVADVEVPSGFCDISASDSLGSFSVLDTPSKMPDSKCKESSNVNSTRAATSPHCELLHTSQGNEAKDSLLEASVPSYSADVATARSSVDSRGKRKGHPMANNVPKKGRAVKALVHSPSPAADANMISPPNTRASRAVTTTNYSYVNDSQSVDVSLYDKPSDDSTYIEAMSNNNQNPLPKVPARTSLIDNRRSRKIRSTRSRRTKKAKKKKGSPPVVAASQQPPDSPSAAGTIDITPPPPKAKIPSRHKGKSEAKKKKQQLMKRRKATKSNNDPHNVNRDRFDHIMKVATSKFLMAQKNTAPSRDSDDDSDLFSGCSEDEAMEAPPERVFSWSGKQGLSKIACSLKPAELGKFYFI